MLATGAHCGLVIVSPDGRCHDVSGAQHRNAGKYLKQSIRALRRSVISMDISPDSPVLATSSTLQRLDIPTKL